MLTGAAGWLAAGGGAPEFGRAADDVSCPPLGVSLVENGTALLLSAAAFDASGEGLGGAGVEFEVG